MRVSQKFKNFLVMSSVIALTIALLVAAIMYKGIEKQIVKRNVNAELAKSKTYAQVADGDEATNSDNVQFDAFFLRDLDLDGNAEKLRGSCRQIGKEDTLYMELNVLGEGYLKDGKITINDGNYYLKTEIVKDKEITENVLTEKASEINFNKLNNGTQKLLSGGVRSGYYRNYDRSTISEALKNNINNYSKVNSIKFTGTHVIENEDGEIISEVAVEKIVNFNVDWYGENSVIFYNVNQTTEYENDDIIKDDSVVLNIRLDLYELEEELIGKKSYIEGTIPEFNGFKPTSVELKNGTGNELNYDSETGNFTIVRECVVDENGRISNKVYSEFKNNIEIKYPVEAYNSVGNDTVELKIPVRGYFESYNNDMEGINNPTVSNIAEDTIDVLYTKPRGQNARFLIDIYDSKENRISKVSKNKPLNIYNGVSVNEDNDTYCVVWNIYTGTYSDPGSFKLKEQSNDTFIKLDSSEDSMDELTINKSIKFERAQAVLGNDGWIKVYNNDTNELIMTFTKNNWDREYVYSEPVKHIRIETSESKANESMLIYNTKKLDDSYIVDNYTRDEFDNLKYIKSKLEGYINNELVSTVIDTAYYEEPFSDFKMDLSIKSYSTQDVKKNASIDLSVRKDKFNSKEWEDGIFVIELPEEIAQIKINSIDISDNAVNVDGYEVFEKNNKNYIKIYTSNDVAKIYNISIKCDIIPNPKSNTANREVVAYAMNKKYENYYENAEDIHDLDNDGNITEKVGISSVGVKFISPNSLLTSQEARNYSDSDEYTIAPRIAEVSTEQRTATVQINLNNNYANDVSDVFILGKIPFENNTYVGSSASTGSNYSTTMTDEGITVPERYREKAKVYYSIKENPTKDINDSSNAWTLTPSDFSKVKSYLIDISEYTIERGIDESFSYNIQLPEGVEYEKISNSVYLVYFALNTDEGKYYTQTEPSKLGFKIVKKYNFDLTKYQINSNVKVSGATYLLTQEKENEEDEIVTRTSGTREGVASFKDLYINRKYKLKEIVSPNEYELNEDEVEFRVYVENGETKIEILNGTVKSSEIIKREGEDYKAAISVEDKVKVNIEINKIDELNNELENISFKIIGKGYSNGKIITTNENGKASLSNLFVNQEYEIREVKADGYYLIDDIKIKIIENNGVYSVETLEGSIDSSDYLIDENNIPCIKINLSNEKIPTYKLKIIKKEKGKENLLAGAKFKLEGDGIYGSQYLLSNDSGEINVEGLYQFVEGKNIDAEYVLTEIEAPEGYILSNPVKFKVENENGTLKSEIVEGSVHESSIEEDTLSLIIEDKPVFKIIKENENGEPLQGVKFSIYEIDENGNVIDFGRNVKNEYVGTKDQNNNYYVETDENGEVSVPLDEGLYKIVEIETLDEYELSTEDRIVRIVGNVEEDETTSDIIEVSKVEDLIEIAINTMNGNSYEGKTIRLMNDIDFDDVNDYRDPNYTGFGDLNNDGWEEGMNYGKGTPSGIYDELRGENGVGGIPIGSLYTTNQSAFKGIFDGQNHWIKNYYTDYSKLYNGNIFSTKYNDYMYTGCSTSESTTSIFGYIDNAVIKNLKIENKYMDEIKNRTYLAGIIGKAKDSKVVNCEFYANNISVKTGESYGFGGIVNEAVNIVVENCKSYGNCINADDKAFYRVGGIIAIGNNVELYNCENYMNNIGPDDDEANSYYPQSCGGIIAVSKYNTTIENCYNYGNIWTGGNGGSNEAGGIIGEHESSSAEHRTIKNCINYGNIRGDYSAAIGGIAGRAYDIDIKNCINYGRVYTKDSASHGTIGGIASSSSGIIKGCVNKGNVGVELESEIYGRTGTCYGSTHTGGIVGSGNIIEECYNEGDVYSNSSTIELGGIASTATTIKNCYNTGNFFATREGITRGNDCYINGIANCADITNCYNIGVLYKSIDGMFYSTERIAIYPITPKSNNGNNNYYLKNFEDCFIGDINYLNGTAVTYENMKSEDFYNMLNVDNVWEHKTNSYPTLKTIIDIEKRPEEIVKVVNKEKQFNIMTRVKTINGVKGGSISGEEKLIYETVKYNNSNEKTIIMTPDTNYEINSIRINGVEQSFIPNLDGTYTLPTITEIKEDKIIEVEYVNKEESIVINKVDSITNENIEQAGVEFNIKEIDDRNAIDNSIIGNLEQDTSISSSIIDHSQDVSDRLGQLTNNGDYYFVEKDGKYVPNNTKSWQMENVEGATGGINDSCAQSYVELDLSDLEGNYAVEINAEILKERNSIYAIMDIKENTSFDISGYSSNYWKYIYNARESTTYISKSLEGGKKYYIHFGFKRPRIYSGEDKYDDNFIINSVKAYKVSDEKYGFDLNDGIIESNNTGIGNSVAYAYMPIDLTNYQGKYYISVDAQLSCESSDSGSLYITEELGKTYGTNIDYLRDSEKYLKYSKEFEGGKYYYLYFKYQKDDYLSENEDKLKILKVEVIPSTSDYYNQKIYTNNSGKINISLPYGHRYLVQELNAPDGYEVAKNPLIIDLRDEETAEHEFNFADRRISKVTTNHKIATRNGDGTYTYTEDEIVDSTSQEDVVGNEYTTKPIIDLEKYELITDENGKEIIPENATGEYTVDEINVNYYYVKKQVPLTVNHYIVGTTTPVPSRSGSIVEPEEDKGEEGEEYTTTKSADASDDYELAEAPKNANGSYAFPKVNVNYFYQPIERNIIIRKISEDGETRLEGAKFKLYADNDEENANEYITDSNGEFRVRLNAGTYHIQEIEAPIGHTVNDEIIDIDISEETEDYKVFEMVNNQKRGTLIVNHYIIDGEGNKTTNRIVDINGEEVQEISKIGIIGSMWATKPYEEAATKYEIAEEPDVAYGDYIDGEIEVNYYYRLKDTKVTVHHYIQEEDGTLTTNKVPSNVEGEVVEDVTINGQVDDEYHTSAATNIDNKYELVSEPRNATGTMTEDEIEVIYYYQIKESKVTAKYIDLYAEIVEPDDTDEIAERQIKTGKVGKEYTTDQKDINGYTFIRAEGDETSGTFGLDDKEITYCYAPNTNVTVRYLEKGSNEVLSPEVTKDGYVGKEFETDEETIDNYTLVEVDGPVSGTMTKAPITTTYYYLQNTKARVEYIDRTDNRVMEYIEQTGLVGDEFRTEAKEYENYILVESPEETTINMAKDMITLRYYYIKNNASLTVRYINVLTGAVIDSDIETGKTVGDEYHTAAKEIPGYEVVGELNGHDYTPDNADGYYSNDPVVVDYYYIRKASVTTRYIDKATGEELAEDVVINGYENDPYQTEEKTFTGYVLDRVDGNTNSIMNITTDDEGNVVTNKVVTYYYKKASNIVVNHIDVNTDEILSVERKSGFEGDNYSTTPKKIKSYDLVETRLPENKDGKFTRDEQVINYYYIKKLTVVVEYLDKITGARLAIEDKIEGHEGDTYTTTPKELLGYEVVGVPKNAAGIMQVEEKEDGTFENEIRVTYYYKIPCRVVVEYIDKETGKKLTTSLSIEGYENDEYETKAKEFDGYELIQTPDNAKGIMKVQLNENKETTEIIVRYYYAKKATGVLPQTGEAKTILYIVAIIANIGLAIVGLSKIKKEN